MKSFSILIILVILHSCLAQTSSRSNMWIIANEQVYTDSEGFKSYARMAQNVTTLYNSTYLTITGQDSLVNSTSGGTVSNAAVFTMFTFTFNYNDGGSTANKVYLLNDATQPLTNNFGSSNSTVTSASGSTWLSIQVYPSTTSNSISSSYVIIEDMRSMSTISINQWYDSSTNGNKFYMFILQTTTSQLDSSVSSSVLSASTVAPGTTTAASNTTTAANNTTTAASNSTTAASNTTTSSSNASSNSTTASTTTASNSTTTSSGSGKRKKRDVEERDASSCGFSSSSLTSINNNAAQLCTNILSVNSRMGSALSVAGTSSNVLTKADSSTFSAAESMMLGRAYSRLGLAIAISSVLFSLLY